MHGLLNQTASDRDSFSNFGGNSRPISSKMSIPSQLQFQSSTGEVNG
jgi:hypothetical protein